MRWSVPGGERHPPTSDTPNLTEVEQMNALMPFRSRLSLWPELEGIQERMNRVFGTMPSVLAEEPMQWIPAVDLKEMDEEFVLTAELPGLEANDVVVDLEDNILTLRGEKKSSKEEQGKDGRWHLFERSYGAFHRSFSLPRNVQPDKIKAEFDKGLLMIHLPKKKESKAQHIQITAKK